MIATLSTAWAGYPEKPIELMAPVFLAALETPEGSSILLH